MTFLPVGYRGNASDESGVKPTQSIATAEDRPCAFFPSLLYKNEIKVLDLTLRDPRFILSTWLDFCLQFLGFLAMEYTSFTGRKISVLLHL